MSTMTAKPKKKKSTQNRDEPGVKRIWVKMDEDTTVNLEEFKSKLIERMPLLFQSSRALSDSAVIAGLINRAAHDLRTGVSVEKYFGAPTE